MKHEYDARRQLTPRPGSPLSDAPRYPLRWTAHDKRILLARIKRGDLTEADAIERYAITADELASWAQRYETFGHRGLQATRLQFRDRHA